MRYRELPSLLGNVCVSNPSSVRNSHKSAHTKNILHTHHSSLTLESCQRMHNSTKAEKFHLPINLVWYNNKSVMQ